jgi:2-C-methyl-D-erythritol 4-phosphate cytidylyltransferase
MKKEVIVVAGGVGKRMGSTIPKQFLRLNDEIILMRTIRLFYEYDPSIHFVVTLPSSEMKTWEEICKNEKFQIPHTLTEGGNTRFHSVKNALKKIEGNSLVAVQDAVRPLVSKDTIKKTFHEAASKDNAIPVADINDSIRYLRDNHNRTVDRNDYKIVQTPQVFESNLLLEAYKTDYQETFTDDASVVENYGAHIHIIKGNPENIKITTKKDLAVAEVLSAFMIR